ncbi:MAG: CRISPR-associated endonuclease Cas1 [Gammaproteobacteria bacterium]
MAVLLNTLYVTTPKAYLRLEGETVCVMVEKEKRLHLQVPMPHLGGIVCFGEVMLSPALLGRCMEDGRSVVWLERGGHFQARVEGPVMSRRVLDRSAAKTSIDIPAKSFLRGAK